MRDRFGIFGTVTRIRKLSTFGNDVKNTQHQYRLSSRLIAMIQNLSFSGKEDENPYLHIRDSEQTCDCLRIEGISDKTLRWKLFPFSLRGEARQ